MKGIYTKTNFLIVILFICFFTTGCWSSHGVEELTTVSVQGRDYISDNGFDKWKISVLHTIPKSMSHQSDQMNSETSTEIMIYGLGSTIKEAFNDLNKRFSRIPYYAHLTATVCGRESAEEAIVDMTEHYIRYQDGRPGDFMFITKGQAVDILKAKPVGSSSLSEQITTLALKTAQGTGVSMGVPVWQLAKWMLSEDRDAVLPDIELMPIRPGEDVPQSVIVEGFGVLRGSKLVGWLNRDEARGYLFITQGFKGGPAGVALTAKYDGKNIGFYLYKSKRKIESEMVNNIPKFTINISATGIINENRLVELSPQELNVIESSLGKIIHELTTQTITKAKEYNSDFLGLMENLHRTNPKAWKTIKQDWHKSFSEAEVEVEVDVKVVNGGQINKNSFKVNP